MVLLFVTQDTEMEMLTKVLRVNVLSWWLVYLVGPRQAILGGSITKESEGGSGGGN